MRARKVDEINKIKEYGLEMEKGRCPLLSRNQRSGGNPGGAATAQG